MKALAEKHDASMAFQSPAPVTLLAVISRAASDATVDVEKMERLMAMYERITARDAESAFNAAMSRAQSAMGRVSTDALNPQTRSRYATYGHLDRALRPIYTDHGFALSFDTEPAEPGMARVVCRVSHSAGHCRDYHIDMPADGKGAKGGDVMTRTHATGAAMSYGMRYLLKMIFNVAIGEDDTDGNVPASAALVSDDQAANLEALLTEVGADREKFLRWIQSDCIESIHAADYTRAVRALEAKRQ